MKIFAKNIPRGSSEVSMLAIVETLVACALAIYLTQHPKWMAWLALYICLAPLLLLRTKASVRLGLAWFARAASVLGSKADVLENRVGGLNIKFFPPIIFFIGVLFFYTSLPLLALPVKAFATFLSFRRRPLSCFQRIPANWVKQVSQTDSTLMPELLPGIRALLRTERVEEIALIGGPDIIIRNIKSEEDFKVRLIMTFVSLPLLILPLAIGLLYRWSLKATAVVWMPLAYLLHGVFRKRDSLEWRVKDFMKGPLALFLLVYSGCVLFFNALLPFVLRSKYLDAAAWLKAKLFPEALMRYYLLAPTPEAPQVLVVQAWHLAGLVSAAITLGLYFWASTLRNQLDSDGFSGEADKQNTLRKIKAVLATRAVLTTYTMACGIVAFAKAAEWKWAQFTVQFLP